MRALAVAVVLSIALSSSAALASERHPTLAELEREVMCPTCQSLLELSDAPVADRMRAFIRARIRAGDTKGEIKSKLVADFGEGVLAAPPARGFGLVAWALPLVGLLAAVSALTLLMVRSTRARSAHAGSPALDPDARRRLDEELARFDVE